MAQSVPRPKSLAGYFQQYVDLVPGDDALKALEEQTANPPLDLEAISEKKAGYAYAPGKWTVKEVLGHLIDGERIFAFRALWIARGGPGSLTGFPQDEFVSAGAFQGRGIDDLRSEWRTVRAGTLSLLRGLPDLDWSVTADVNGNTIELAAIPWLLAGHERHHLGVLRERYGLA